MRFLPNPISIPMSLSNNVFKKHWLFDLVLNDFLLRSISRFRYEVSFEALDKCAIDILLLCYV
uniref:Uncharacterized protein n=1 Tax=Solanum lycopersicum TaxID=4081 RepID=A0A3Q7IEK3_SOLLC